MPIESKHKLAVGLTFGLFALWGLGHRLYDTLVPEFAKAFALGSRELVIGQSVYSLVYFLFAIPAAIYARAFGSKAAIVLGLGCWCVGSFLFYPAALQHVLLFVLFAAAVMSCGYIMLEIAANPFVARMGPPETAVRRLNFAHALYPVGVLAGLYVGRWVVLSNHALPLEKLGEAVVQPYMVLGAVVLALAFIIDLTPFPAVATHRGNRHQAAREIRQVLTRPLVLAAVGAQFCNVAAMAGTWTLSAWYVQDAMPGTTTAGAADFLLISLILFGVGRFAGALLMYRFDPHHLLAAFAGSGLVLGTIATLSGGTIGVYAMVASSFSMSILFATILGIAIKDLGPLTKAGTALVYMGGSGSAIGVAAMHLVWTVSSIQLAMLVPTLGYAGVVAFALVTRRRSMAAAAAQAAEEEAIVEPGTLKA
jgi:MFS transporter, FHS family, L-fucose permease